MARTKRKSLEGLTPGTEEYVLKHAEWRRSRGKRNPSECINGVYNGRKEYELLLSNEPYARKHNEWLLCQPRKKIFVNIANPKRSLLIAQRHKEQFDVNSEKAEDEKFEDKIIHFVKCHNDNEYSITCPGGLSLWVDTDKIVPKAGQLVRYYEYGNRVRGIDIEGIEIRYESERQMMQRFKKELKKQEREDKDRFKKIELNLDARFELLPVIFKERIENFRRNNLHFRWKYEESEIKLTEEALRIANFMHSQVPFFNKAKINEINQQLMCAYIEDITNVYNKIYDYSEEQLLELIPDFRGGHSGNSHGFVFNIALMYLTKPEFIFFAHGWLAPMQGCANYGCHVKKSKKQKKMMVKYAEAV